MTETLTWKDRSDAYKGSGEFAGYEGYRLNERIIWIRKTSNPNNSIIPVGLAEDIIVDLKNNNVLVKRVNIWAGKSSTEITRFWTHVGRTFGAGKAFSDLVVSYTKIGGNER